MRATAGIRRAGAAALDLADVACGRFEAFWELTLAPWDIAAGMLLVREAGGIVTDLDGAPCRVAQTSRRRRQSGDARVAARHTSSVTMHRAGLLRSASRLDLIPQS